MMGRAKVVYGTMKGGPRGSTRHNEGEGHKGYEDCMGPGGGGGGGPRGVLAKAVEGDGGFL